MTVYFLDIFLLASDLLILRFRTKLVTSNFRITLHLKLSSTDSQGGGVPRASSNFDGNLPEIRPPVDEIVADLSKEHDGFVLTTFLEVIRVYLRASTATCGRRLQQLTHRCIRISS